MAETRTYQGHTYTRNGPGEPWTLSGPAPGGRAGVIIPDPYKAKEEARKDQDQQFDAQRIDMTRANNEREAARTRVQNPQDLRQEYEKLAEVTTYKTALQQARRAMDTDANPQGDLALTYAFAKAMDPTSAVREGEQASVANSQPMFQSLVERVKKQFGMDGAGSYTPQARAALRQQIFRQVASLKPLYDRARADMSDNAKAVGVDPKEVVGRDDTETYAPMFRDYGEKQGDPQGVISRLIGGEPIKGSTIDYQKPGAPDPAGYGASKEGIPIPEEMQKEYFTYLNQNWGKLDPSGFSAFRINLDRKYGLGGGAADYRSDAVKMNELALKGQGPEVVGRIPPQERTMGVDRALNDLVASPTGTAVATGANMIGGSLPSRFAGDQFNALRTLNPKAALVGDVAGGVAGAVAGGMALRAGGAALGGTSTVARALANPLTADVGYGAIVGANDAAGRGESQLIGGLTGGAGGFIGNKVGGAIGRAFPGAVKPLATRGLDASVPTSDDLKTVASGLYSNMETNGLTASGADTFALADGIKAQLAAKGRITPKDNLANTEGPINAAYKLVSDYGGEPMDPTQYQTVRSVIADGLDSKTKADRKIAKSLLGTFDDWTAATNPAMKETWDDARAVSSRYLQGDALKEAGDLAGVRAGQFSQAGMENALRVDYRALARNSIKSKGEKFTPQVNDAIRAVTDGSGASNALRVLGALAPVSPGRFAAGMTALGAGAGFGGPLGAGGVISAGGLSTVARALSQSLTKRAAQVAENTAYGGPEYADALSQIIARAGERGSDVGTGFVLGAEPYENNAIARILAARERGLIE